MGQLEERADERWADGGGEIERCARFCYEPSAPQTNYISSVTPIVTDPRLFFEALLCWLWAYPKMAAASFEVNLSLGIVPDSTAAFMRSRTSAGVLRLASAPA